MYNSLQYEIIKLFSASPRKCCGLAQHRCATVTSALRFRRFWDQSPPLPAQLHTNSNLSTPPPFFNRVTPPSSSVGDGSGDEFLILPDRAAPPDAERYRLETIFLSALGSS